MTQNADKGALSQTVFNAWAAQKCSECECLRPYCVCKHLFRIGSPEAP